MIQFGNTAYPWWLAMALVLAAAIGIAGCYKPFRALVRLPSLWGMAAVRALALLLLALLLLAPFLLDREPDPQGVRIAVLVDASGSMSTRDTQGEQTRLETAFQMLAPESSSALLPTIEKQGKVEQYLFAEDLFARTSRSSAQEFLPGKSAIGDALQAASVERSNSARTLGGVVLLTDGHENSGSAITEAAKNYAAAGIPISVIGLGEPGRRGDVRVEFVGERMNAIKGEATTVPLRLESSFNNARKVAVTISEGRTVLERREIDLAPGASQTLDIEITPPNAGLRVLRTNLEPVQGDQNPATDVDYLALEVSEPLEVQVHWWAARPGWELRYLQRMVEKEEQLRLSSIIKTSSTGWLVRRPDEDAATPITANEATDGAQASKDAAVPPAISDGRQTESAVPLPWEEVDLSNAAALVLDAELGPDLSDELQDKLRGLVENRGIGLLVYGDPAKLPEKLRSILPVTSAKVQQLSKETRLRFDAGPVFAEDTAGALDSARLFLRGGDHVYLPEELKPAARTLLALPSGQAILSLQAFGSGRIAYAGTQNVWRWSMETDTGGEEYTAYWRGLLAFLSANTKDRVSPALHGRQLAVDDPANLEVDVLGADFRPATNARVTANLTKPDGQLEKVALNPSLVEPGRFEAPYQIKGAGEYQVEYEVELPEGETLRRDSFFTASFAGAEMQDTSYQEEVLRDVARITGGWFAHYSSLQGNPELPLRDDVPMVEKRVYLAQSWVYLVVIVGLLAGEWFMRRRHGMK